jgi:hypothetical protein
MRYLVQHGLPAGITREEIEKLQRASLSDKDIRGYRSFLNLSEGKGVCLIDAPSRERLVAWLEEHEMPFDSIMEVELEGERGRWVELPTPVGAGCR